MTGSRVTTWLAALGAGLLLGGCAGGEQSMLDPVGTRAQGSDSVWQVMLAIGSVVWVLVAVGVAVAVLRGRGRPAGDAPDAARSRRLSLFVILAGAVVPGLVILAVTVQSVLVLRDTDPSAAGDGVVVEVVGHQFWWEVRYPEDGVVTANEIHIPTGERVRVQVTSDDVIHSVWVPQLSGKMDMVPGHSNTTWFETEEPGTYWGQCAEFCGLQHARMRLVVVAHERAEYEDWVQRQALPAVVQPVQPPAGEDAALEAAVTPDAEAVARGREVFMSSSCVYCHAIQGTAATGRLGPDLTHLASRSTLAAGVLDNDRGNLAAWIVDPQDIKPGNLMPGTDLSGPELQDLLTYLESLE